jgi:glycosyltransferase involved in cell wall biosynthesis
MDLLTIVVPVYNTEPYLNKTLHSLCSQTYTNLEILLIDDGSTDNSLAVCRAWAGKDQRIRVVAQENAGVAAARNRGIALASGKYLMFVDADDWIEPDMLKTLHDLAVTYDTDVACCVLTEESTEESDRRFVQFYNPKANQPTPGGHAGKVTACSTRVDSGLAVLSVWGPVCKLYRTALVRKVQFENYQVAEDLLFNTNVILQDDFARAAVIDYPFYHYVIYPGSAMKQKFQQKYLEAMKVEELCYNKLIAISPKYGDINLIGCSVSRVFEKYAQLSKAEKKEHREDFRYCKRFAKAHKKELLATTDRHRRISGMLKVYVPDLYLWTLSKRKKA